MLAWKTDSSKLRRGWPAPIRSWLRSRAGMPRVGGRLRRGVAGEAARVLLGGDLLAVVGRDEVPGDLPGPFRLEDGVGLGVLVVGQAEGVLVALGQLTGVGLDLAVAALRRAGGV